MRNLRSSYISCKKGVLAVEAALILPILIVAGLGAADTSMMLLQNHKAETQLAIAASYMSKSRYPKSIEHKAKNLAVTGQLTTGGQPLITSWSTNDVTIAYKSVSNPQTNGTRLYRGGDKVEVVQISTEISYSGLGIVRSILRKNTNIKVSVEERLSSAYVL